MFFMFVLLLFPTTAHGLWLEETCVTNYNLNASTPSVCASEGRVFLQWISPNGTLIYKVFNNSKVFADNITISNANKSFGEAFLVPINGTSVYSVWHNETGAWWAKLDFNGDINKTYTLPNCTILSAIERMTHLNVLMNTEYGLIFADSIDVNGPIHGIQISSKNASYASAVFYKEWWRIFWIDGNNISYAWLNRTAVVCTTTTLMGNDKLKNLNALTLNDKLYLFYLEKNKIRVAEVNESGKVVNLSDINMPKDEFNGTCMPYGFSVATYRGGFLLSAEVFVSYDSSGGGGHSKNRLLTLIYNLSNISDVEFFGTSPPENIIESQVFVDDFGISHIVYVRYLEAYGQGAYNIFYRAEGYIDISILNFTISRDSVMKGENISFSVNLTNKGTMNAENVDIILTVRRGGSEIYNTSSEINISLREIKNLTFLWKANWSGEMTARIYAVSSDDINWSDNSAVIVFRVIGKPDFVVSPDDIAFQPGNPMEGDEIRFLVNVKNEGDDIGNGEVMAFIDNKSIGVENITLTPDDERTLIFIWKSIGGKHNFIVKIENVSPEDMNEKNNEAYIEINVGTKNSPPQIEIMSPEDNSEVMGEVIIRGMAWDADGEDVMVTISIDYGEKLPVKGNLSWEFFWDTTSVENGIHTITAYANDGKIEVSNEIRVYVNNTPLPEKLISKKWPKTNTSIYEGENIDIGVALMLPSMHNMNLTIVWYINGKMEDYLTNRYNFTFFTNYTSSGNYLIEIYVKLVTPYGTVEDSTNWSIYVIDRNRPPEIKSKSPEKEYLEKFVGQETEFSVNATDKDGDAITYSWYIDGEFKGNSTNLTVKWRFPGNYRVEIVISDGNTSVSAKWEVKVERLPTSIETSDVLPCASVVILAVVLGVIYGYLLKKKSKCNL